MQKNTFYKPQVYHSSESWTHFHFEHSIFRSCSSTILQNRSFKRFNLII